MSAALGTPRLHLRLTDSTNERARRLAMSGAPHGTLVTAAEQTAGRGRQGRTWAAPPGSSLLMSVVLVPPPRMLPLAAAVAVCDAVEASAGAGLPPPRIKWPNDVVVERGAELAKLAGILVEARAGIRENWAVLGIGLNAAVELEALPPELRGTAATIGLARDQLEPLLAALLEALARRLAEPAAQTLEAWAERDALRGRRVEWSAPAAGGGEGSGVAAGIDGDGRLVVALDGGGRTALGSGEVHLGRLG